MPLTDREEACMRAVAVLIAEVDDKVDAAHAELRAMVFELADRLAELERRAFAATIRENATNVAAE